MKSRIRHPFRHFSILIVLFALAAPAHAQFLGNVSLTTISQVLGNGTACTGNPQIFVVANLGQTQHLATAFSTAASFVMEMQGVDALTNTYKISDPLIGVAPNKFLVQASGYMPITQVSVTCTAAATFSLTYSGSFSASKIANVSAPGSNSSSSSNAGYVQGVIATGINGISIFPLIQGALGPPINQGFTSFGIDTFSIGSQSVASGLAGNITLGAPPPPSTANNFGLVIYNKGASAQGGTGLVAPWTCLTLCGSNNNVGNSGPEIGTLANVSQANKAFENDINTGGPNNWNTAFVEFAVQPTIRQNNFGSGTVSTSSNTAAGSTLMVVGQCTNFPCQVDSVTDTQGLTWKLLTSIQNPSGAAGGLNIWFAGPSSAAAETATFNAHAGTTLANTVIVEFTNITPANPNQPSLPLFVAPGAATGRQQYAQENDNGGVFTESGGFSYTQTLTFSAAGTNTFPLWQQVNNGVFSSCTLAERVTNIAGAGTTLNTYLQDSADNVGFNDRLSMPQATTAGGATNQLGAFSAGAGGITPAATTDGSLAPGSKLDGPVAANGRIKFVVVGASASVTVTYNVACR